MADSPYGTVGALARKYAALADLRRRRDEGGPAATRAELRALAREFPGCLRELDTLGPTELARRASATAAAAAGGTVEPWMEWIAAYHGLMADALAIRAGGGAALGRGDEWAEAVRAPPGGRLNVVVLRELGRRFGVEAAEVAGVLFRLRRASPYSL